MLLGLQALDHIRELLQRISIPLRTKDAITSAV